MKLTIKLLSDSCTCSGETYNSMVDMDVVYDENGLPYIPAKRIKGCIREAALEMMEFGLIEREKYEKIFGKEGNHRSAFSLSNAYIENYDQIVATLKAYKDNELVCQQKVLNEYTSIRTQTAVDLETGVADENSLRTIRVVNKGLVFEADCEMNESAETVELLKQAVSLVKHIGVSRTRGLGLVEMRLTDCTKEAVKHVQISPSELSEKNRIGYKIHLKSALICKSAKGNQADTEDYIAGSKVLGMIAGQLGKEKYKELNPEKYQDTIEKVIRKGSTPAGMHISIMVREIIDFLQIKPGQTGFDATLGYGGHTKAMMECLKGQGHMYATDVDPIESAKTKKRLADAGFGEDVLTIRLQNFCTIDEIAKEAGGFDFVLADLGVSSMQIDNPDRGFSFKVDGPLDLRLNPEKGISAAERLAQIEEDELAGMLWENSDEPYAEELAHAIVNERKHGKPIDTTTRLREVIEETLSFLPEKEKKDTVKKTCQRTFQALRIDVNNEFEVLYEFMEKLPGALKPGGRAAILTFHSGEDKLVKKALKQGYKEGIYSEIANDVVRPSAEECAQNGRARSTKMRWAVRAE